MNYLYRAEEYYKNKIAELTEERNTYHKLFCFSVTFAATMLVCCIVAICLLLFCK